MHSKYDASEGLELHSIKFNRKFMAAERFAVGGNMNANLRFGRSDKGITSKG